MFFCNESCMSKQAGVLYAILKPPHARTQVQDRLWPSFSERLNVLDTRVALMRRLLSVWSVRLYEHVSLIRACLGFTWIYWYYTQRSFRELMTDQRFHSAFVLWLRTLAWITIKDSFIVSDIYLLLQLFRSSSIVPCQISVIIAN